MANPSWFNESEYLNGKLVQLNANGFKDANGNAFTSISQVADAITAGGMSAFEHYNEYGSKEGISPSNAFNAVEYCTFKLNSLRTSGPDAQKAEWATKGWLDVQYEIHKGGMSLGEHYSAYGFVEGVPMSNAFDGNKYLEAKLAQLQANEATSKEWAGKDVPTLAASFRDSGTDPYTHYLTYGGAAGEVPSGMSFKPDEQVNPGGEVKTLTTGMDNLVAGPIDTTFVAGVGAQGNNALTFNAGDRLTGGAGNDTLLLDNQGNVIPGAQTVTGIENVTVVDTLSAGAGRNLDMSQFAGMQKLSYSGVNSVVFNAADTVTDVALNGFATSASLGGKAITNVSISNIAADADLAVHNSTADALNLTLENVGKVDANGVVSTQMTLTDSTAKALNVTSNGTNTNNLALGNDNAPATVTITGAAGLNFDVNGFVSGGVTSIKSINGSTAEGGINLSSVHNNTNDIKTGAGNDSISMNFAGLTADDKIDMGAGDGDTLELLNAPNPQSGGGKFDDKSLAHMKGILAATGVEALSVTMVTPARSDYAATGASGANGLSDVSVDMTLFDDALDTFSLTTAGNATGSGFWGQAGQTSDTVAGHRGGTGGNGMLFVSDDSTLGLSNSNGTNVLVFTGGTGGSGAGATATTSGGAGLQGGHGGHGLQILDNTSGDNHAAVSFNGSITFAGASGGAGGTGSGGGSGGGDGGDGGNGLEAGSIKTLDMFFSGKESVVSFRGASGGAGGAGGTDGASGAGGDDGAGLNIAGSGTITLSGEAKTVNLGLVTGGGNLTIDASGMVAGAVKAITLDGNDTLIGGAGSDSFKGGNGLNTYTGNGGNDIFSMAGRTDVALRADAKVTDIVMGFKTGADKLDFTTNYTAPGAVNYFEDTTTHSSEKALFDAASKWLDNANDAKLYVSEYNGSSYLVTYGDADGNVKDIVKLDGVTLAGIEFADIAHGTSFA